MIRLGLHDGHRVIRECGPQCQNAKERICKCVCGGVFHGIGVDPEITEGEMKDFELKARYQAHLSAKKQSHSFMGVNEGNVRVIIGWEGIQQSLFVEEKDVQSNC